MAPPDTIAFRPTPGDPAPWFFAPTAANPRFNFASVAGRYVLLAFLGPATNPASAQAVRALREARAEGVFNDLNASAFAISMDPADAAEGGPRDQIPGLRVFLDRDGAVSERYGVLQREAKPLLYRPAAFLLDPLLRVIASAPLAQLPELIGLLRRLPPAGEHAGQEVPAPVLVLPRVLEPALCQALIDGYEANGGAESGFMVERDGRTIGALNPAHKRRRDADIEDPELQAALRARIARRIAPEMRKAFQFDPTRIERYIVACYDSAEGGHFRAHRDNTTPGTAHRRFAVTINLNDGFEGGELWFPEFGPRRYRPPPGGAVVFSCSLLHEATPVRAGRRYATLPFLYDDAAARLREANQGSLVEAAAAEV
ncbi:2OG-Fe(II) oxygenase [Siccirubricoccus sp. G192]|uniref:2OG-Fe(II) oxygenase n=1 Tax=Siccirubricoccus sp. G192 TaxID=2849651 RepID=UPI001C2CBF5C|nr:2OG-Fe(II) oxygenase [Siccirubricoccus sp. G192]MBV1795985.1 2OG-Fe(II) oxygenase [Siccirubricoccus sp. G192]